MRNLEPAMEKDLNAAGIFYASEVKKLGVKKTFIQMLEGRLKLGRSDSCCNALYLYSIYGAIQNLGWRNISAIKKKEFKDFTNTLRKSGYFSQ